MRTTLTIDDTIVKEVILLTKKKNRSEAIREALSDYIHQKRRDQLLSLRGNVDIDDNWQALREMEVQSK